METINKTKRITGISFLTPHSRYDLSGSSETAYSITGQGMGSLTGVDYTVSAHSSATIKVKMAIKALTSQDMKDLNDLALTFLTASQREEVKEHEKITAQGNASIWGWFFGGGASASYEKTRDTMKSKGLTNEQIDKLMDTFLEVAQKMSTVEAVINVDNTRNDYSVSGSLYLYTIAGSVQTSKGTYEFRMLADKGTAGYPPDTGEGADTKNEYIPLN